MNVIPTIVTVRESDTLQKAVATVLADTSETEDLELINKFATTYPGVAGVPDES